MAAAKRQCKGETKKGAPCKAAPLTDGDYCLAHADQETRDKTGFGGPQEGAGRPPLPRPHEVLRQKIESDIERWLAPLEAALGEGKPVVTWDQMEGRHEIQYVPDPELGMKAMKLAFEHVYGRPRQQIELTGEDGGPVAVTADFDDPKVQEAALEFARRVGDAREERSGRPGAGS